MPLLKKNNQHNMQDKSKNVWVGKADLVGDTEFVEVESSKFFDLPVAQELSDEKSKLLATPAKRRDFLKMMGFSLGAATVAAACEAPIRRAIPYMTKPDAIVPGVPTYYASTIVRGGDVCPVLVKTREGRPIKIEGNKLSSFTKGGTSARAQASVLDLYDSNRYAHPMKDGQNSDWSAVTNEIKAKLKSARGIKLISNTIVSPFTKKSIADFIQTYSNAEHVVYDAVSSSAMLDAHKSAFGTRALPSYHFDKANVILSLDADFLGTWISPIEYAADFIKGRKVKGTNQKEISRLYAVESAMTLTGSNADNRVVVKPSQSAAALVTIYNRVASKTGGSNASYSAGLSDKVIAKLNHMADDLWNSSRNGRHTLVVNGANNLGEQLLTIELNRLLGNFGSTITTDRACYLRQGDDIALGKAINDIEKGAADVVIFMDDANPVYDTPNGAKLAEVLNGNVTSVALTTRPNDTSTLCSYICPIHHNLESWGDAEAYAGELSLIQPVISPLHNSRAREVILAALSDNLVDPKEERMDYAMLRNSWNERGGQKFWEQSLSDGFANGSSGGPMVLGTVDVGAAVRSFASRNTSEREVKFYETVNIGAGQYASNPWLQEMPDPIYRTVWDNFVTIPVSWDGKRTISGMNGWSTGDVVEVTIAGKTMNAPVVDQFGVVDGAHGMALGYGRKNSGAVASNVGINVFDLMSTDDDGYTQYYAPLSFGNSVGESDAIASVQYHHTFGIKDKNAEGVTLNVDEQSISAIATGYQGALTDRSILYHANIDELESAADDLHHKREHAHHLNEQTIYEGHDHLYDNGHKWEMNVDLSSCIGCGACQVACIAENNVPVVGKEQVKVHHEMTWMRIDRYFFGDIESPNTAYQPMMCQHCDNAPCENVCPVGATQHSSEGLNHMTYNRCIGTRYCANNCPFKVRRFNWLDYTAADLFGANENDPFGNDPETPFYAENLTRMVLNPDVTVRTRGVIEKCSFCIQKIQQGKLLAKSENRALVDGDVTTACATACPTGAIVFGDINNKDTEVAKLEKHPLNYYVLEETNVRSAVGYRMKVTNRNNKINELDA